MHMSVIGSKAAKVSVALALAGISASAQAGLSFTSVNRNVETTLTDGNGTTHDIKSNATTGTWGNFSNQSGSNYMLSTSQFTSIDPANFTGSGAASAWSGPVYPGLVGMTAFTNCIVDFTVTATESYNIGLSLARVQGGEGTIYVWDADNSVYVSILTDTGSTMTSATLVAGGHYELVAYAKGFKASADAPQPYASWNFDIAAAPPVPAPGAMALLGLAAFAGSRRRR